MIDQAPQIPPAVMKLAENEGFHKVKFIHHFNSYDVYAADPELPNEGFWGQAPFILHSKNDTVRFATSDEYLHITLIISKTKQH